MKKRTLILAVLAVVLVLSASIGSAVAYFTTYATARGGYVIHLGGRTEIEEDIVNNRKPPARAAGTKRRVVGYYASYLPYFTSKFSSPRMDSSCAWAAI